MDDRSGLKVAGNSFASNDADKPVWAKYRKLRRMSHHVDNEKQAETRVSIRE